MKTPVLLLGSALIFWGWQVDKLIIGIILAIAVESGRLITIRWDFSGPDQKRVADACMYLMVAAFLYSTISAKGSNRFFQFVSWLPMLVSPLVMMQVYGNTKGLYLSSLSLIARKKKPLKEQDSVATKGKRKIIDSSYIYLGLCLVSAGIGNNRLPLFFGLLFVLVAWAIWSRRNHSYPAILVLILLLCGGGGGYIGQGWLQELQKVVEQKSMQLLGFQGQGEADPFQANTAIGSLGTLKLSDSIVARVFPEKGQSLGPDLLRNGCYNVYQRSGWYVSSKELRIIPSGQDGATWDIHTAADQDTLLKFKINTELSTGKGLLAVPVGTSTISKLPVEAVEVGIFSSVRLQGAPRRLNPTVSVNINDSGDQPPVESDLRVPGKLQTVLQAIISENNLHRSKQIDTVQAIKKYFNENYTYSLVQDDEESKGNGMEFFLTKSQAGHCEYFATATVLLLRMAGIPARYVTGWAVSEFSELEQCYLVRSRHAHAWGMVYIDKQWQQIDTTPPDWQALEAKQDSFFRPVLDFFSWCRYKITDWLDNKRTDVPVTVGWIFLPLVIFCCYRFLRRKRQKQSVSRKEEVQTIAISQGIDSDFYMVESRLIDTGKGRFPSETARQWLERIGQQEQLSSLLNLHQQYRFDPQCDLTGLRKKIEQDVREWLNKN